MKTNVPVTCLTLISCAFSTLLFAKTLTGYKCSVAADQIQVEPSGQVKLHQYQYSETMAFKISSDYVESTKHIRRAHADVSLPGNDDVKINAIAMPNGQETQNTVDYVEIDAALVQTAPHSSQITSLFAYTTSSNMDAKHDLDESGRLNSPLFLYNSIVGYALKSTGIPMANFVNNPTLFINTVGQLIRAAKLSNGIVTSAAVSCQPENSSSLPEKKYK